jgi:undecaprenyl-diphosphatase
MLCCQGNFGVIAQNVTEGRSFAFDRRIFLALRDSINPSAPVGPVWVQETARDLTSLGSIIVLSILNLAVSGYLFLARKSAAAGLMIVAGVRWYRAERFTQARGCMSQT